MAGAVRVPVDRQRESAEDLAQDTLLAAYRHWSKVLAADDGRAYVARIMINLHRSATRRRRVSTVAAVPEQPDPTDALGAVDRDGVWDALRGLPQRQRAVLVLRHWADLDDIAIARIVGCRRATVRSLAARGLAGLRSDPRVAEHEMRKR